MVAREEFLCRHGTQESGVPPSSRGASPAEREKPIAQIAKDLGIAESGLRRWMAQADIDSWCSSRAWPWTAPRRCGNRGRWTQHRRTATRPDRQRHDWVTKGSTLRDFAEARSRSVPCRLIGNWG